MPENRMLDPDYRCVPAEPALYHCDICFGDIYEGDRYAEPVDGAIFCMDCAERLLMKVA